MKEEENVFADYINQTKGRMTKARTTILKEIYRRHDHFNADDIYMELKQRNFNISRASIYRIFPHLLKAGLIRELNTNTGKKLYEHILGHKHHEHMKCDKCGALIEFKDDIIEKNIDKLCSSLGFVPESHTILITGICKKCNK
jgi:Fur family transcriptional regulator, ferric uptake regulator